VSNLRLFRKVRTLANRALFAKDTTPFRVLLCRHQSTVEVCAARDILEIWLPVFQIVFSIIQNLTSLARMLEGGTDVARDNWCVVEEVQKTTTVASEDNLLLGALDGGGEFGGVGFF
jgi:hypothetical protein